MKFKVGDRVRAVKTISTYASKKEYIGRVLTITNIREGDYPYNIEPTEFWWREDELELAPFTKSDLKDGMVVEYRNGVRRMVLDDKLIGYDGHLPMNSLRDDLCYDAVSVVKSQYDVVKVYKSSANIFNSYFEDYYLTLIWERPKSAKKMTVEEIEKELGYKVEIVSDSENK